MVSAREGGSGQGRGDAGCGLRSRRDAGGHLGRPDRGGERRRWPRRGSGGAARPGARRGASPSPAGGRCCGRGSRGPAAVDEAAVDRLYPRLLELYGEGIAVQTRLYDGAEAALDRLEATGWGLGGLHQQARGAGGALLEALGVGGRFRAVLGADTPAVAQARPAAPARDDRARRGACRSGRCWSGTR